MFLKNTLKVNKLLLVILDYKRNIIMPNGYLKKNFRERTKLKHDRCYKKNKRTR